MRQLSLIACAVAAMTTPMAGLAQEPPVRWQRRGGPTEAPITVFHSTQSANLPTAETLRRGELLFEISHRFQPPMSDGAKALWGLDGPVTNRLGLAFAVTDRVMLGVLRSNLQDNVELDGKVRLWEGGRASVPVMVGAMGGVAFNTQIPEDAGYDGNETQAYAQLIVNALVAGRLALGAVPTWLHNPRIADSTADDAFVLGLNGQLYLSSMASVFGEWVASGARPDYTDDTLTLDDAVTLGLELETGGHFFKLLVTNSTRLDPTQMLPGTRYSFTPHQWRFGFNITRLLSLKG